MKTKIVNEAIMIQDEQSIYIQRYVYPQRSYVVVRRAYTPDEEFLISSEAQLRDDWWVSTWLTDPDERVGYADLDELFALIYSGETWPSEDEEEDDDLKALVSYDAEKRLYHNDDDGDKMVFAPTLQEAIEKSIAALNESEEEDKQEQM